ncbi:hypothetical protein Taro_040645 [Colocasia esculenta]|uniref:Dynamin N-terminal domain-containing protein n=1 Tax=Colocasia esculenta TaxID=4460 RepID=A0A843W9H5_COLES|nr:hypothetical protein [Colocasia esculenta]
MEAMEELTQLADAMVQAAALLADEDVDEGSSRGVSTFLNVVALGNVGAGKSAVLNSLIGHPVLPTGENGATRAPISIDLQRDGSLNTKSIILQIDNKSQQVSASEDSSLSTTTIFFLLSLDCATGAPFDTVEGSHGRSPESSTTAVDPPPVPDGASSGRSAVAGGADTRLSTVHPKVVATSDEVATLPRCCGRRRGCSDNAVHGARGGSLRLPHPLHPPPTPCTGRAPMVHPGVASTSDKVTTPPRHCIRRQGSSGDVGLHPRCLAVALSDLLTPCTHYPLAHPLDWPPPHGAPRSCSDVGRGCCVASALQILAQQFR